jgi:uncharacterized protein YjbJ (UPF0337 family)
METKLKIKENWTALKKELKQKYVVLTDAELTYQEGREDELVATISKKVGKTKDEVSNVIKELQTKMAVKPLGERTRVDTEKSNAAVKSYNEREGILAEKTKSARNLAGEGEDIDADPRHIVASKGH